MELHIENTDTVDPASINQEVIKTFLNKVEETGTISREDITTVVSSCGTDFGLKLNMFTTTPSTINKNLAVSKISSYLEDDHISIEAHVGNLQRLKELIDSAANRINNKRLVNIRTELARTYISKSNRRGLLNPEAKFLLDIKPGDIDYLSKYHPVLNNTFFKELSERYVVLPLIVKYGIYPSVDLMKSIKSSDLTLGMILDEYIKLTVPDGNGLKELSDVLKQCIADEIAYQPTVDVGVYTFYSKLLKMLLQDIMVEP